MDYDLECNGFEVVKDVIIAKDIITFSVKYIVNKEKPHLNFTLNLTGNVNLSKSLYGFLKHDKMFISRSSFKNAEETYLDYLQENDKDEYERIRSEEMICDDPIKPSSFMKLPSASLLASNPNTYVQGIFKWYDDNKQFHPLQFNRVELWDKEPTGETLLATTYTNENGFYRFEFINADKSTDFENGGYDVFVRVLPMGENTRVYKGNGKSYQMDLGYYKDIPTGTLHYVYHNFYMRESADIDKNIDWDNYDFTFDQALQVSQAVIFASKYAKEMNGDNIASVSVRYPHGIKDTGCYYLSGNKTIYIKDPAEDQKVKSYAAWDPIMHEYGHHVQYQFDMVKHPSGTHWTNLRMGDHYMHHLHGFPSSSQDWEKNCKKCASAKGEIKESECKLQGNRIAWAEGWSTYFGIVAQQYFMENLSNINTVGDSNYTYTNGANDSLTNQYRLRDDCEGTVQSILYEMYDNSSYDAERDSLALGHKVMWDMTTGSKAKTFQEFDTYFRANCTDKYQLKYYGRILAYYNLAPSIPTASSTISTVSPTFTWSWNPSTPSIYFNNTYYELNFYDYNYNLIGTTSHSPSDSLWTEVINSGYMFYVSVTRYENNSPVSSYEGELYSYSRPSAIQMPLSGKYTRELGTGDCYWFVFTAPQNATFVFETTGSTDTYGELFSQMIAGRTSDGRITFNDDDGEENNFRISYSMNKGDVVYLRVRGYNWDGVGEFTLSMSSPDHVHEYTYSYTSINDRYHTARCSCGESIQESYYYINEKLGNRCKYCGHYTEGFIPVPILSLTDIENVAYLNKKENDIS